MEKAVYFTAIFSLGSGLKVIILILMEFTKNQRFYVILNTGFSRSTFLPSDGFSITTVYG